MDPRHDFYLMLYPPQVIAQVIPRLQGQLNRSYHGPSTPMAPDRLHAALVPLGSYRYRIPPEVLRAVRTAGALLDEAPLRGCFDTLQSRGPRNQIGNPASTRTSPWTVDMNQSALGGSSPWRGM